MPRNPALHALAPMLCALCLTACANQPVAVQHLAVPGTLLTCPVEPTAPSPTSATDAQVASWVVSLRSAGADCRGKLSTVAGILAGR